MNAVWLVRLRQVASRMRFWTAIVGYDPRDHSLSQHIYLIYVIIFFCLWGFAMLALIADLGTGVLTLFKGFSPIQAAILLTIGILLVDVLLRCFRYAKRSPFIFSEEDAVLICQTPVDRRQVAIAWLFGDWIPAGMPYWAGAVILSFACQQLAAPEGIIWTHLPIYLLTGLYAASIMLPLHLAFMTSTYVFGALRLRGDKDLPNLRLIPIVVGVSLLLLARFLQVGFRNLSWPVVYPLEAGFGVAGWLAGFALVVFLATMSLLALYLVSQELNLSRAFQESDLHWKYEQVGLPGRQIKIHQWLGLEDLIRYIPASSGVWVLIWKECVQILRRLSAKSVISWLVIFGLSLVMMIATDWGTRIWVFIVWGLLIGQVCSKRFNSDMNLWVFFRQLPFSGKKLLLAEIASSVVWASFMCWFAYGISSLLGFHPSITITVLAPGIILCITLAGVFDILRQSKPDALIAGNAPEMGAVGLLLGLILTGLPFGLVMWITSRMNFGVIALVVSLLGLILCLGIAYGLWQLAAYQYKKI